jgi:alpha-L-fucosidase
MKKISILFFALCLVACRSKQSEEASIVTPTAKQVEWAQSEIGVLIHFDMPVFHSEYNWRNFGTHPDASSFNPIELDTDQWLEAAHKLGAKYAVLVAKHCSGFSLWPTKAHEYSIKHSPWKNGKGDIVADFMKSCKKYGIKPGIYASTGANGYLHVDGHQLKKGNTSITQAEYNKVVETQLTELWSNYGELFEIWFDGGVLALDKGGADILSLVKRLQPNAVAFQGPYKHPNLVRWVGNEEGVAPYPCWATADSTTKADGTKVISDLNGNPYAPYWCPGESDFTLRWNNSFQGGWFWKAGEDEKMFTVDELMVKYETSVGRNTNMLLGIVIDDRGLVPSADMKRIEELGTKIRNRYASPLKSVSGEGTEFVIELDGKCEVDRVVIQENIKNGERILAYTIEGLQQGTWIPLAKGSSVGNKRIERFDPQLIEAIRFSVPVYKAQPDLKIFSVFQR